MSNALMKVEKGITARQEFGSTETQRAADTAVAAVTARERALVEAQYIVAERHPRDWMDVRAAMLQHCSRPRFAEVSRYAKPIGKKKVNGQWIDDYAKGFTVRFAETLTQEAGNIKPDTAVTFEDDLIRIVRISVTDLQRNICRSREVTIAKATEKRGKQDRSTQVWSPPEGREVISQRVNSYGDPVYLVKATDDEMRNRVNSEESKTQRDFVFKLCPRDILEDCEDKIAATLATEDKKDPEAAKKKLLDRFVEFGLMPTDLQTYVGKPVAQWTEIDRRALVELGAGIRDGQITFDEALRVRYSTPTDGEEESARERDGRQQRQAEEQLATAQAKERPITQADINREKERQGQAKSAEQPKERELTDEENRALDAEIASKEESKQPTESPKARKLKF